MTKVTTEMIEYDQIGNPTRIGTFDMSDEIWTEATDYEWHGDADIRGGVSSANRGYSSWASRVADAYMNIWRDI